MICPDCKKLEIDCNCLDLYYQEQDLIDNPLPAQLIDIPCDYDLTDWPEE